MCNNTCIYLGKQFSSSSILLAMGAAMPFRYIPQKKVHNILESMHYWQMGFTNNYICNYILDTRMRKLFFSNKYLRIISYSHAYTRKGGLTSEESAVQTMTMNLS